MSTYTCPTCRKEMQRDMSMLYDHTNQHIVEAIKEKHPKWATEDGICRKCFDYYKFEIGRSPDGVLPITNIGETGIKMRRWMGIIFLLVSVGGVFWMQSQDYPKTCRLGLFVPFFISMMGFIQSQERVCAAFGLSGVAESDSPLTPVKNKKLLTALKTASTKILLKSAAIAAVLTATTFVF